MCVCVKPVNDEPRLREESTEVRQVRADLNDNVERLINQLELAALDNVTSATVAIGNDSLPGNGQ